MKDENNNDEMPSDEEWRKNVVAYLKKEKRKSKENPESWEFLMLLGILKIQERTANMPYNTYFLAYASALVTVLLLLALKIL